MIIWYYNNDNDDDDDDDDDDSDSNNWKYLNRISTSVIKLISMWPRIKAKR